ncbi:conserved Plasmodium protein, unknown function [Plasmodium gallinaceum]|uniref:Parasitophorous vacuolar protein 5 n=1 Tax=Plasmodium gallinaceum TaxID=5849 RepID=A0A1J1GWW1_PLAGA|nr:conserved Plasmodium protein, unknown function [Plasmodium gallinaceum]CRG96806.1 conserved Plasmodium protein, unknown function [Plasmodium gallinaceum]
MIKLIFYIFLLMSYVVIGKNDGNLRVITKNIDLKSLQGTFYEIAINTTDKIFLGLACRCTKYEFSGLKRDGNQAYILMNFTCDRNFLIKEEKSNVNFKLILNKPLDENTTTVEEFDASLFLVENNQQILLSNHISIIYAEFNDQNEIEHFILGGNKSSEPMIIMSKYRTILQETYKRLINSLYLSGYESALLNWPFIIQTDQTLCE